MKTRHAGKTAYLGLYAALAVLMGYVEALLPFNFGIPGFKLGLCNIVIVFVLFTFGFAEALIVSLIRILIIGFMFGNLFSIVYSAAGTVLALVTMRALIETGLFSSVGISAAGGAAHNTGQLIIACMLVRGIPFMQYYPVLTLLGCGAGCATGILILIVMPHLPKDMKNGERYRGRND